MIMGFGLVDRSAPQKNRRWRGNLRRFVYVRKLSQPQAPVLRPKVKVKRAREGRLSLRADQIHGQSLAIRSISSSGSFADKIAFAFPVLPKRE